VEQDLFHLQEEQQKQREAPLAVRMRPRDLNEFHGQTAILAPGKPLHKIVTGDLPISVILYGPPGTGKTTLARLIARRTAAAFVQLNAVNSGVADIRRVVKDARDRRGLYGQRTIVFIDELHRFNRAQQDALLPFVEDGTVTLIGATTENPFYAVNAPLVSRARVFEFVPLNEDELTAVVKAALADERGLPEIVCPPSALAELVRLADGDARRALNILELSAALAPDRVLTVAGVQAAAQRRYLLYDRAGDQHYDTISAFIKSLRGSDPDAALHYLARMLEAGEDPLYIARRLIVHASEDVGLADPRALSVAVSACQAVEMVGLPEGRLALAQAALYIATAPKSNAVCTAIDAARRDIQQGKGGSVPPHLRNPANPAAARQLGHGQGYKYPHDYPGNFVPQSYLPDDMAGSRYYQPTDNGYERKIRRRLQDWRQKGG
jgi:putative ATPase